MKNHLLMKKFSVILLLIALLTTAGCSGGGDGDGTAAPNANDPVTLRFMWWGGDDRHNATVEALDVYMERNKNITVEAEYGGWDGYRDKLTTQLAGGTAPDLIQCSFAWAAEFQSQGKFFTDIAKHNIIDLSEFDDNFLDEYCRYGGELIALPSGVSPFAFVVNSELLTNAGFDYEVDWDWDTIVAAGQAIQAYDPTAYLLAPLAGDAVRQNIFFPYLDAMTGTQPFGDDFTIGFTREQALEAAGYVKKLIDEKIAQPASEGVGLSNALENPTWVARKIGATFSWSSSILLNLDPWLDVAKARIYPYYRGKASTGVLAPPAQLYVIPEKAHPAQAVDLLNFVLTDEEALLILKDVRSIPATKAGLAIAEREGFVHPLIIETTELGLAHAGFSHSELSNNAEVNQIVIDAFDKMLFGDATAEAVVDEIFTRVPDKLAELKAAAQ